MRYHDTTYPTYRTGPPIYSWIKYISCGLIDRLPLLIQLSYKFFPNIYSWIKYISRAPNISFFTVHLGATGPPLFLYSIYNMHDGIRTHKTCVHSLANYRINHSATCMFFNWSNSRFPYHYLVTT